MRRTRSCPTRRGDAAHGTRTSSSATSGSASYVTVQSRPAFGCGHGPHDGGCDARPHGRGSGCFWICCHWRGGSRGLSGLDGPGAPRGCPGPGESGRAPRGLSWSLAGGRSSRLSWSGGRLRCSSWFWRGGRSLTVVLRLRSLLGGRSEDFAEQRWVGTAESGEMSSLLRMEDARRCPCRWPSCAGRPQHARKGLSLAGRLFFDSGVSQPTRPFMDVWDDMPHE